MPPDFDLRLSAFAEVILRIGLNLQPGQRLLIAEPYELQGVDRSAEVIVEAVKSAALEVGCPHPAGVKVIWGDAGQLRQFAQNKDWRGFVQPVADNARRMQEYINKGDALLFLQSSQPRLMDGVPASNVAELRRIAWEYFGPIAQQLVQGATNWTVAPAPTADWAAAAGMDVSVLWQTVFQALRIDGSNVGGALCPDSEPSGRKAPPTLDAPLTTWRTHLAALTRRRDALNAARHRRIRYIGPGTDLTVTLPPEHTWCTAQLTTRTGLPFVANLPTEEIFTAPHRDSAEGTVRVSRPVSYGGSVIDGIELEFKRGRVVAAGARTGADLLQRILDTDEGAGRLGEVALVGNVGGNLPPDSALSGHKAPPTWQASRPFFYHPLLDENAHSHVALGEAYGFCLRRPNPGALNRSLVHVDLPLDASVILPGMEPA